MKRISWQTVVIVALMAGILGFALVTYILADKTPLAPAARVQSAASQAAQGNTNSQPPTGGSGDALEDILGMDQTLPGEPRTEKWTTIVPRIIVRLALATLLAALLAFRPRRDLPLRQRNLYVAQTQILLAVVGSALMMIVGDNAARAFGIFAAVSLVRFRTNIRDPKEITVLLLSLALGLASGVGRWDLAVILCVFVMPLLWLLESKESEEVYRSMELTVKTRDTNKMQDILKRLFIQYGFDAELRQLDPPDEDDPIGSVVYYMNMSLGVSTDEISDEIRAADTENIEAIEWEQKKDMSGYN